MKHSKTLAVTCAAIGLTTTAAEMISTPASADQRFIDKRSIVSTISTTCGASSNNNDAVSGPCLSFSQAYLNGVAAGNQVTLIPLSDGTFTETLNLNASGQNVLIFTTTNIHPQLKGPAGADAIDVHLGDGDIVQIFNLWIVGGGNTANVGVNFSTGRKLQLQGVTMRGFGQQAVLFQPTNATNPSDLLIDSSDIADMSGTCVLVKPQSSTSSNTAIRNSLVHHCGNLGIRLDGTATTGQVKGILENVLVAEISNTAVSTLSNASQFAKIIIERSQVTAASVGVVANGSTASAILNQSTVSGNGTALSATNGGSLFTTGTNVINFNGAPGSTPTNVGTQ